MKENSVSPVSRLGLRIPSWIQAIIPLPDVFWSASWRGVAGRECRWLFQEWRGENEYESPVSEILVDGVDECVEAFGKYEPVILPDALFSFDSDDSNDCGVGDNSTMLRGNLRTGIDGSVMWAHLKAGSREFVPVAWPSFYSESVMRNGLIPELSAVEKREQALDSSGLSDGELEVERGRLHGEWLGIFESVAGRFVRTANWSMGLTRLENDWLRWLVLNEEWDGRHEDPMWCFRWLDSHPAAWQVSWSKRDDGSVGYEFKTSSLFSSVFYPMFYRDGDGRDRLSVEVSPNGSYSGVDVCSAGSMDEFVVKLAEAVHGLYDEEGYYVGAGDGSGSVCALVGSAVGSVGAGGWCSVVRDDALGSLGASADESVVSSDGRRLVRRWYGVFCVR